MRTAFVVSGMAIALAGCGTTNLATSRAAKAAQPALAAPGAQTAQPPLASAQSKKVCKSIKPIGSNYPKRICSTKEEWDLADKRAKEQSEQIEASRNRDSGTTVGRNDGGVRN